MGMIKFTEDRRLLDDSVVKAGEERDFGAAENAAFVGNGVAAFVDKQPVGAPAASQGASAQTQTTAAPAGEDAAQILETNVQAQSATAGGEGSAAEVTHV